MISRIFVLFLAVSIQGSLGGSCTSEGTERCSGPNGKSGSYFVCENGREVEHNCEGAKTCYGNGYTGILCIDAAALKKRQAQASSSNSAFGGYEPLLNSFNNGLYGDANSFGNFVNNMRSMMMVDKNSLSDVADSISDGISKSKQKVQSNTVDLGQSLRTTAGQQSAINSAKKFRNSLNQNKVNYSYLVTDTAQNSKSNPSNLRSMSGLATNSLTTAVSGVSPTKDAAISSDETTRALNNLNLALNVFYPNTLGAAFKSTINPQTMGGNVADLSSGNSNGTINIFRSLIDGTNQGTQYITPFAAASVSTVDQIAQYATPARLSNVFRKYAPKATSSSTVVNTLNGAANAATQSRGQFRSSIDNSFIAYRGLIDTGSCGCGGSDSFSVFFIISALLSIFQLVTPAGGCCAPNVGGGIFARSLI